MSKAHQKSFHKTLKFRNDPTAAWQQFPIVAGYERFRSTPPQSLIPPSKDSMNLYGNFPPQLYQHFPIFPEDPNFVLNTPEYKPKKKLKRVQKPLPKDTMKLVDSRPRPGQLMMDVKLIQAVQQPNSKFVIDKFFFVPAKQTPESVKASKLIKPTTSKINEAVRSQKLELQKQEEEEETATVKVESIGMSSADQPIPDYSAFFPRTVFTQAGSGDEATLILEPNSRALSGNDGTSISAPISRAIIHRGTAVKVLFRPQSVAITGANGIAHAQADLILDFIESE